MCGCCIRLKRVLDSYKATIINIFKNFKTCGVYQTRTKVILKQFVRWFLVMGRYSFQKWYFLCIPIMMSTSLSHAHHLHTSRILYFEYKKKVDNAYKNIGHCVYGVHIIQCVRIFSLLSGWLIDPPASYLKLKHIVSD